MPCTKTKTTREDCCMRLLLYKESWETAVGEELELIRSQTNVKNRHAIAVLEKEALLGTYHENLPFLDRCLPTKVEQ